VISLRKVTKSYDNKTNVVKDLDLEIEKGELVVLVGESGCGKTTTMKMINRLIEPSGGEIYIDGKDTKTVDENELRRNIGYVIQNIGLFPHLTIEHNIATVPLLCKRDKDEVMERVRELLDLVDLPHEQYAHRFPRELSGGQQQRVGVARALANDPDIILMDEPFSALDPITREQLQNELLKLQDELQKTIVFVTHDIDEALKLGDRIAVMAEGKILQYDKPEDILKNPISDFVESFVGSDRLWKTPDMLRAEDIMSKKVVEIGSKRSVAHAIELMKEHNTSVLAVVDKVSPRPNKLLGIVGTNRLKGVTDNSVKMGDIMKTGVVEIPHDMNLTEVLGIRKDKNIQYSPVVDDDGKVIGIITNASIVNVLTDIVPETEEY